jgi:hypothetical protein
VSRFNRSNIAEKMKKPSNLAALGMSVVALMASVVGGDTLREVLNEEDTWTIGAKCSNPEAKIEFNSEVSPMPFEGPALQQDLNMDIGTLSVACIAPNGQTKLASLTLIDGPDDRGIEYNRAGLNESDHSIKVDTVSVTLMRIITDEGKARAITYEPGEIEFSNITNIGSVSIIEK